MLPCRNWSWGKEERISFNAPSASAVFLDFFAGVTSFGELSKNKNLSYTWRRTTGLTRNMKKILFVLTLSLPHLPFWQNYFFKSKCFRKLCQNVRFSERSVTGIRATRANTIFGVNWIAGLEKSTARNPRINNSHSPGLWYFSPRLISGPYLCTHGKFCNSRVCVYTGVRPGENKIVLAPKIGQNCPVRRIYFTLQVL